MAVAETFHPIRFEDITAHARILTQYRPVPGKLVARGEGLFPCVVEETFPDTRRLRVRFVYRRGTHEVGIIGETDAGWHHIHSGDARRYDMPGVYRLEGKRLTVFDSLLREHAARCYDGDCKRVILTSLRIQQ